MQIEHRMDAKRGNLIWLSDGRTEAAAALDFGIRIVHLSCAGKPNLFYSQPDDLSDGLATEAGWRIYGGHRFWSSPESTRSYYPDNAPVACELLADGVCLRQRTDPWTGFEKTLILRFLPDGRLSAEHILTNRNPQTVELYLNHDVMELETLGVLARLAPGQSTHHTEFWTLEPLSED